MFRKYRSEILIALASLAIAAAWVPIRMRFPFDDTYITFRYAANLAHGFGIVWNPGGAHTEGYTNFLFMLMLVPFSWMGCDLVVVSQMIGVVAVVVSAIAIYRIVGAHGNAPTFDATGGRIAMRPYGIFATALFLLDPFTWLNAFSGMETSLFTMWLLLAMLSVRCGGCLVLSNWRSALPFVFATLAAITRPEGAIIGVALIAVKLWPLIGGTNGANTTNRSSSSILPFIKPAFYYFIFPLLLYALWKLWYFGNLFPNSFYIKVARASASTFLPGRGTLRIFYEGVWYLLPFAIIAFWKERKNRVVQIGTIVPIAGLWCIVLSAFYLFSQLIQPQYGRFTNSIEVMLIVLAAIGLADMSDSEYLKKVNRAIIITAACLLVILNCAWSLYFRGGLGDMTQDTCYVDIYQKLATVLHSVPDHEHITFAWADAGILPYYSGMRNLDVVGLNSNEIAHANSPSEVVKIIMQERPDIIFIPLENRNDRSYGYRPYSAGRNSNVVPPWMSDHPRWMSDHPRWMSDHPRLNIPEAWDTCWTILRDGHGLIGSAYPALAAQAIAYGYEPVVVIDQTVYNLNVLVDTRSPHYHDMVNRLAPLRGFIKQLYPLTFEKPVRCMK